MKNIPKIIHQIWIGPKEKPQHLINTWKEKNPDWEHILWDEEKIKEEFPEGLYNQLQYDSIDEYCGKADILRYEILYKHGGFYCDADTICLEKLDDFFLENNFFSCYENENINNLISNGYIGAEKNSILLKIVIDEINKLKVENINSQRSWISVGPLLLTKVINANIKYFIQSNLKIEIYPSYLFIPEIPNDKREKKKKEKTESIKKYKTYSNHLWLSTFQTDLNKFKNLNINTDNNKKEGKDMKIGLSCIVKNESKVILKMLESVYSIIDYWHIVDTGSTDGTQDIIKNFFHEKNIPGDLTEITWKDFSTSRNEALKGLKGKVDWGFWIDADEILEFKNNGHDHKKNLVDKLKKFHELNVDGVFISSKYGQTIYKRLNFFNLNNNEWYWFGPIHEYLKNNKKESKNTFYDEIYISVGKHFGNSWTSQTTKEKYEKYIKILKEYIEENQDLDNSRWIFYLAQSYKDTGCPSYYDDVIDWYNKRINYHHEGYTEEKYISQLNISKFKVISKKYSESDILFSFLQCSNFNNKRIDHFEWVIEYYHSKKNWELAYLYSSYAIKNMLNNISQIESFMFLNSKLYNWKMFDIHCMSCFYTNRKEEMQEYAKKLKQKINDNSFFIEENDLKRIENNMKYYLS